MKNSLQYIERKTQKVKEEKIFGGKALQLFYGDSFLAKVLYQLFLPLLVKIPLLSWWYGKIQTRQKSRKKIRPFVQTFEVDASEFEKKMEDFSSFNDFFIRKIKREKRPIANQDAVLFADARYRFFPKISRKEFFTVKKTSFSLRRLLQDKTLAGEYEQGTMVIARLCPSDYHRFHFPCEGVPSEPRLINGYLYSVSPIALKKNAQIYTQNKRYITEIQTERFGKILYIEIGATNVGSVHQTYTPFKKVEKGAEKGYFSFGASCIIVLFPPSSLQLDTDLVELSKQKLEIRANMGESLGSAQSKSLR